MMNPPFTKPPTGIWGLMAPVKGRIAGAIALAVLSAITSLGSLLAVPPHCGRMAIRVARGGKSDRR